MVEKQSRSVLLILLPWSSFVSHHFENNRFRFYKYRFRWQVIEHYITRVRGNMQLLEQLDMIGRTSELARLFGIQFYEVFTRGSQVNLFHKATS